MNLDSHTSTMSSFFSKAKPLSGGSPANPVPCPQQAATTERTLAQVRKSIETGAQLQDGMTGGSSGILPTRPKPPRKAKGGGIPPSDVAAAAMATTRAAIERALKGGAPPVARKPRAKALKGGLLPDVPLTASDFRADYPIDNPHDGGPYVTNNGITFKGFNRLTHQSLAGVVPNVSHAYAPVQSSWNARGIPGAGHMPQEWREGLGTALPSASLDAATGQGGADIGAPGSAQRATAAKLAGAGPSEYTGGPPITISDTEEDDSDESDEDLEGGALSKRSLLALEGKTSKRREILRRQAERLRRLALREHWSNYKKPNHLRTVPRRSAAQKAATAEAMAILKKHGYSASEPGSFGTSGLL